MQRDRDLCSCYFLTSLCPTGDSVLIILLSWRASWSITFDGICGWCKSWIPAYLPLPLSPWQLAFSVGIGFGVGILLPQCSMGVILLSSASVLFVFALSFVCNTVFMCDSLYIFFMLEFRNSAWICPTGFLKFFFLINYAWNSMNTLNL